MNIQKFSAVSPIPQEPQPSSEVNFKAQIVTLSQKNLGQKIATNVVDTFNGKMLNAIKSKIKPEATAVIAAAGAGAVISKPEDFQNNVNFFTLAAGSGSRFAKLAQVVGEFNKISLPFKIGNGENIHMLDFAMTMGKYFIGNDGVQKIVAEKPSGSFGDIVQHYMKGNPIKDTVVCCGDNVFGDSAAEMMTFFTKEMNNPDKHLALVGVPRPTEQVLDRFGCLEVEGKLDDEALKLKGFVEKPKSSVPEEVQHAKNIAIDGQNIANTGMFYISKDAMTNLINEIKNGNNPIKKSDSEPYDFANACIYVHKMIPEWFGLDSAQGADVKLVKKWEDVGEPTALYEWASEVKKGEYLKNFPQEIANKIKTSFNQRIHTDNSTPRYINFTENETLTKEQISQGVNIDGVNIIA